MNLREYHARMTRALSDLLPVENVREFTEIGNDLEREEAAAASGLPAEKAHPVQPAEDENQTTAFNRWRVGIEAQFETVREHEIAYESWCAGADWAKDQPRAEPISDDDLYAMLRDAHAIGGLYDVIAEVRRLAREGRL